MNSELVWNIKKRIRQLLITSYLFNLENHQQVTLLSSLISLLISVYVIALLHLSHISHPNNQLFDCPLFRRVKGKH